MKVMGITIIYKLLLPEAICGCTSVYQVGAKRIHYRGINNIYRFVLSEAVCCCLQTSIF